MSLLRQKQTDLNQPAKSVELIEEPSHLVKILHPFVFEDERGNFVKPFHEEQLGDYGISMNVKKEFFSTSAVAVLRGLHF